MRKCSRTNTCAAFSKLRKRHKAGLFGLPASSVLGDQMLFSPKHRVHTSPEGLMTSFMEEVQRVLPKFAISHIPSA